MTPEEQIEELVRCIRALLNPPRLGFGAASIVEAEERRRDDLERAKMMVAAHDARSALSAPGVERRSMASLLEVHYSVEHGDRDVVRLAYGGDPGSVRDLMIHLRRGGYEVGGGWARDP